MNKDQVKGVAKHIGGEIQEQAGKLTGNASTEARGHAREKEGKIQKNYGDAKERASETAKDLGDALESNRRDRIDSDR